VLLEEYPPSDGVDLCHLNLVSGNYGDWVTMLTVVTMVTVLRLTMVAELSKELNECSRQYVTTCTCVLSGVSCGANYSMS